MRAINVKLKISTFEIDEWVVLESGSISSLKTVLESYIRTRPITSTKGLAYTARSGHLYSLRCNLPSGIITKTESASKLYNDIYLTIFWRCIYANDAGRVCAGIYPRPGVDINKIINFKNRDVLSLALTAVTSMRPI